MSQPNLGPTPANPPGPDSTRATAAPSAAPIPKKKKRRWLVRLLIAIPVLLFLVVALLPTLLSTSFGRSLLMPTVAKAIAPKGKLEISNWSFGWFSPIKLEGIKITDLEGRHLFQGDVTTGLTLFNAIRGDLSIGDTTFTGDINDVVGPDNKSHLLTALGVYDWPPAKEPPKMPNLSGKVDAKLTASVELPPDASGHQPAPIRLEQGTEFKVDLTHVVIGIGVDSKMIVNASGGSQATPSQPTTFTINGTADVVEDSNRAVVFDPFRNTMNVKIGCDNVDSSTMTSLASLLSAGGAAQKPLVVSAGGTSFQCSISRDAGANKTNVDFNFPLTSPLVLARGDDTVTFGKDAIVSFSLDIIADPSKPAGSQIREVAASRFKIYVPSIVDIEMVQPVRIVTDGTSTGQLGMVLQTGGAGKALAILTGGANPMPYAARLQATQSVQSDAVGVVTLTGDADLVIDRALAADAKPIPADLKNIKFTNAIVIDLNQHNLTFKSTRIEAPNVLSCTLTGSVGDIGKQNTFNGVALTLDADKKKLVQLLNTLQNGALNDVDVAGKGSDVFTIEGSYPMVDAAGKPVDSKVAIKSIKASGVLTADSVTAKGISLTPSAGQQKILLPITLADGVVRIAMPGKTGAEALPPPLAANGTGKINLGGLGVDLTGDSPAYLSDGPITLVDHLPLNPALNQQVTRFLSPIFAGFGPIDVSSLTDRFANFSGTMTVQIEKLDHVPLDIASAKGSQIARIKVLIPDLKVEGGLGDLFGKFFDSNNGLAGNVPGAVVEIRDGKTLSDLTLMLSRTEKVKNSKGKMVDQVVQLPIRVAGNIDLKTLVLADSKMDLPTALIKSDQLKAIMANVGPTVSLPITGTLGKATIDTSGLMNAVQKSLIGDNPDLQKLKDLGNLFK